MLSEQQQRILGYFIEEAKDHLNTIEQGLLNLQSTIADAELASEVFRAAHSVKGGAAMLGLDSIQQTSHRLEDYFKVLKECPIRVDQRLETLLLNVFDVLKELLDQLQGPFGLTDDKANEVMASIEPVFTELNSHLSTLVQQAGSTPPEDVQLTPTPAPVSRPAAAVSESREDSAFLLIFQSDVPARLRDMLQLFKQPDVPEVRQQLLDLCQSLTQAGEQFDLTAWGDLVEVAKRAIAHTENSFRALAPVIIKDIKQAQEQVLAGNSAQIAASETLRSMTPVLAEPELEELDVFDFFAGEPDAPALDLADLAEVSESEPAFGFEELMAEANQPITDGTYVQQPDEILSMDELLEDEPAAGSVSDRGPQVGMAELNSLADLFEADAPDLGLNWEEDTAISSIDAVLPEPLELDESNDFSDLLTHQDTDTATAQDDVVEEEDLSGFFNSMDFAEGSDDLSESTADSIDFENAFTSSEASHEALPEVALEENTGNPFEDLLDLSADTEPLDSIPPDTDNGGEFGELGELFGSINTESLDDSSLFEASLTSDTDANISEFEGLFDENSGDLASTETSGFDSIDFSEDIEITDQPFNPETDFATEAVDVDRAADINGDTEAYAETESTELPAISWLDALDSEDGLEALETAPALWDGADADVSADLWADPSSNLDDPLHPLNALDELPSSDQLPDESELTVQDHSISATDLETLDTSEADDFALDSLLNQEDLEGDRPQEGQSLDDLEFAELDGSFDLNAALDASSHEFSPSNEEDLDVDLLNLGLNHESAENTDTSPETSETDSFDLGLEALDNNTSDSFDFGLEALDNDTSDSFDLGLEALSADSSDLDLDASNSAGFASSTDDLAFTLDLGEEDGLAADISADDAGELFAFEDLMEDESVASTDTHSLDDLLNEPTNDSDQEADDLNDLLSQEFASAEATTDLEVSGFGTFDNFLDDAFASDAIAAEATTTDETLDGLNDLDALLGKEVDSAELTSTGDTSIDDSSTHDSSFDELDFGGLDDLLNNRLLEANPTANDSLTDSFSNLDTDLDEDFAGLDALLDTPSESPQLTSTSSSTEDDFADLEAMLGSDPISTIPPTSPPIEAEDSGDEFDDLEKLLESADQTLGGSPTVRGVRSPVATANRRPTRSTGVLSDQTMRVSVKNLDNFNNLVGELVVNRNSLEQAEERLRQFLDNLLYQVQQLSDVGQRMRDLYERSLLESSLLSSRRSYQSSSSGTSPAAASSHATGMSFDALEMDRFTGFHTLSQEMIELIVRVRESASDIDFVVEETDQITRNFRQITTQIQESLTRARMVPFAQTADRLPRAVRDISLRCGKQAELVIEGRETLIDKMILEQLYDPMTHLVNNAITHGIEPPDERASSGKAPTGRITIRAFHQGNQTVISVSDDGAGIDPERIKRKAIEKGLVTEYEAQTMSRLDVYDLIFHHGFSTRDKADDFAGRGIGMDVVRTSLNEVRGVINIDSAVGRGTTFTIRLPLTLSISKALCCISNRARIAFPMDGVEDMLDVPRDRIQTDDQGRPCIQWRDQLLPFQPLSELLKFNRSLGRGSVYGGNQEDDIVSVIVLRSNAGSYLALQVDQVLGEQEIVIKQLEGPMPKPVGIAGATVLGDGRIMPIADVLELIDLSMGRIRREAGSSLWEKSGTPAQTEPADVKTEPTVLIVDDSITVRELLSMTFNKVGYRVEQARDGQEAWEKLRSGLPCDLVFCDIEMPRMDGLELLSRLQKDNHLNHIPIAMLTSRGADRHRQMAIQLGAKGYFTKPYLEEMLLDAAQRMLKGEVLVTSTSNGKA
ncbi:response regulator [Leptolyngbya sp. AN02str]|uniref:hybrid sensor histidine kinase/response regulator n=1 Tax=Leptolyngbya sp. AN02str TaxID=3423363 RepID=UPI003D31EFB2